MLNNNLKTKIVLPKRKNLNIPENEAHPFHIVDPSPWPIVISNSLCALALSFIMYFHRFENGGLEFCFNILCTCFFLSRWFSDIITESTYEGHHTRKVRNGIRMGMILFIISEVMFFWSFFWAYFHMALNPSIDLYLSWPPVGIKGVAPWSWPLANTALLISSGITVTWAHRAMVSRNRKEVTQGLLATITYAILFTCIQFYEYITIAWSINDSVYGSLFFMLTGFHGLHVIIGTIFLIVCLLRHLNFHFTCDHHVGLECAIWYWHFVDIIWILLYLIVYIWGAWGTWWN